MAMSLAQKLQLKPGQAVMLINAPGEHHHPHRNVI